MHPLAHCMACMTLKGSMYAYDDVDDVVLPVEDHKTGNGSFSSSASLRISTDNQAVVLWPSNLSVRPNDLQRAQMSRSEPCCVARKRLSYQSKVSFHPCCTPALSTALIPRTKEYPGKWLRSGTRPCFGLGTKPLPTDLDPSACSCRLDCMVRSPHTCNSCNQQRRPGVYMTIFSLSVWTMLMDGKRFSGVRWVVAVTCVPRPFRCRSTNHIPQLCGCNPIRGCGSCL
jgi:hypothetical protein